MLHCVALFCTVLHCAAVRCGVLQRVAAHLGALAGGGMLIQFGVLLQEGSAVHVLEWRRRRQFTLFIYIFDDLCVLDYVSIHLFIYLFIYLFTYEVSSIYVFIYLCICIYCVISCNEHFISQCARKKSSPPV